MGIVESIRGVMRARRNQPDDVAYVLGASHERFGPAELVRQAVLAEEAGFDAVACSDHLTPWWRPETAPAHCANAWVWLGAAGQATKGISIGTGVTGWCTATTRWWWRSRSPPSRRCSPAARSSASAPARR